MNAETSQLPSKRVRIAQGRGILMPSAFSSSSAVAVPGWVCRAEPRVCPRDTLSPLWGQQITLGVSSGSRHVQAWLCQCLAFPADPGWPGGVMGAAGKPQPLVTLGLGELLENLSLW